MHIVSGWCSGATETYEARKGVKEQVPLVYRGKFRYISTDGTKPDNVKKKLILPKEQSAPVKKGQKAGAQEYYQDGKDR